MQSSDRSLTELVGVKFLSYILAVPVDFIQDWLASERNVSLSDNQQAVVANLEAMLQALPPDIYHNDFQRHSYVADSLGRFRPELGCNLARLLRSAVTREPTEHAKQGDPIGDALADLAADLYPLFLLSRPPSSLSVMPAAPIYSHPARAVFETEVMRDPVLSTLFPNYSDSSGHTGHIRVSTGHGGSIQLWTFSTTLLTNGWVFATSNTIDTPQVEDLLEHTLHALATIRAAASGQSCRIPVRVGLAGVLLPAEATIEFAWGRLRGRNETDDATIPEETRGSLQTHAPGGELVSIDYCGDAILELDIDFRVELGEYDYASTPPWPADLRSFDTVKRGIENTQLALLLSDLDLLPLITPSWFHYFDPLSNSGFYSQNFGTKQSPTLTPRRLDESHLSEWSALAHSIASAPADRLQIGRRRLLQAAAERYDPADILVDSVIVWESLVGAPTETVFRVSGAIAWLLEPSDASKREQLQKEIKTIYNLRSSVVHGSKVLTEMDSRSVPTRAMHLAAMALRRLLQDRADLLAEKDVAVRSNKLILGQ